MSSGISWGSSIFNSPVAKGSEVGVGSSTPSDSSREGSGDFSLTDVSQVDSSPSGDTPPPLQHRPSTRDMGCQTDPISKSHESTTSQTSPFKVNIEFKKEIRTFTLEQLSRAIAEVAEERALNGIINISNIKSKVVQICSEKNLFIATKKSEPSPSRIPLALPPAQRAAPSPVATLVTDKNLQTSHSAPRAAESRLKTLNSPFKLKGGQRRWSRGSPAPGGVKRQIFRL